MPTGILLHGCNLGAFQWKRISWGDPPDYLGRITRALLVLLEEERLKKDSVAVLAIGTGVVWHSSGKRAKRSGSMEAEEMRNLMFEMLPKLGDFKVFQERFPEVEQEGFIDQLRARLEQITQLATTCQNTTEELHDAATIFREHNVDRAILVSSPVHMPRCLKEACVLFDEEGWSKLRYGLFAAPSDTCYQDTHTSDVAIFEPPHRPDRPMYPIQQFVRRISGVPIDEMPQFLKELDELLEEYGA